MTELDPKKHTTPFRLFFVTNKKQLPLIFVKIILYSLGTLGTIGMAYFVGKVIDSLQGGSMPLHHALTLLIIALVFHEIAYRIGHVLEIIIHARIRKNIKNTLFSYTSKLSFGYFANRFAGQIAHQINTAANSMERMEEVIVNKFVDNGFMVVISAVAIGSIYTPLGIALAVWVLFFILGLGTFARKLTFHAEDFASEESATTGALVDIYANIATVKAYSNNFDQTRVTTQVNKEYRSQLGLGKWSVLTYFYQGMFAVILGLTVIFVILHGYKHGLISVGGIVAISGIVLKIIEYVYETGHNVSDFVRSRGECTQALKDIIVEPDIIDGENIISHENVSVVYKNVSFSYNNQKHILKDFSFDIPSGQKVGIVGLSGAGKTTLVNLLLRFFDPQNGSIEINNVDIATVTQDSLRSHISFISQDTSLFHTSIAENIGYGFSNVSREQIEEAGKMAYADDFILALPKGYDTVVGERGVKLSGGQRQRIAIARAMLKNSPLFLLDEATSALDSDSEAKVQEALKVLMKGKTVIAIAHRLSTLQSMDRIVFIENGKIIEDGTHQELLAKNGKYATLWKMQSGGFLPGNDPDILNNNEEHDHHTKS